MRFNADNYDKVFPREENTPKPQIESVVETFKPSEELEEFTENPPTETEPLETPETPDTVTEE